MKIIASNKIFLLFIRQHNFSITCSADRTPLLIAILLVDNWIVIVSFKYLGHTIEDTLCDDGDIYRELKSLFARANLLNRRFFALF